MPKTVARSLFGSPRSGICAGGVGIGRPSRAQRTRGEAPGRQDERDGGVEWNSVERSACGFAEPIGRDASFSAPKAPGQDSNLCHQPAFAQDLYLGPMRDFAELKRRACVLILPVGRRTHLRTYQVVDPPFRISLPRLDHLSAILKGRGRLPSHCVRLARAVPVLAGIHEPKHRRDGSFSTSGCDHAFDQPADGKPRHCAEQEHRSEDQDVLRLHKVDSKRSFSRVSTATAPHGRSERRTARRSRTRHPPPHAESRPFSRRALLRSSLSSERVRQAPSWLSSATSWRHTAALDRSITRSARDRPPRLLHEALLWPRRGRLRRQGQRLLVFPAPLLQSGARSAGSVGRSRHHGRAHDRRRRRPGHRSPLRSSPRSLGPPPSVHVRVRGAGRGRVLALVESTHSLAARDAPRLLSARLRDRADRDLGLRDPQRVVGARADRPLRRAHLAHQLSLLLRLVGRPRHDRARLRGVPATRRRAPGRRAESGRLPPLRPGRGDHDPARDPRLCRRDAWLHPLSEAAPGETTPRSPRHISRARRDAFEPFLPRALLRRSVRRHGGRSRGGALHLRQHVLLGADVEPDLGARLELVRVGRGGLRRDADRVEAVREEACGDRSVARRDHPRSGADRAPPVRRSSPRTVRRS